MDTEKLAAHGRSNPKKLEELIINYTMKEKERYKAGKIASGTVCENIKPIRKVFVDVQLARRIKHVLLGTL